MEGGEEIIGHLASEMFQLMFGSVFCPFSSPPDTPSAFSPLENKNKTLEVCPVSGKLGKTN